mgnify:CR=1 FL=1
MNNVFKSSKKFMPTYVLIAINIAVYAYTSIIGGNFMETDYYVLLQYGQSNSFVMSGGYWQLFTAMFVHVGLVHLLGNMFFLLIFGLRAEDMFTIQEYIHYLPFKWAHWKLVNITFWTRHAFGWGFWRHFRNVWSSYNIC